MVKSYLLSAAANVREQYVHTGIPTKPCKRVIKINYMNLTSTPKNCWLISMKRPELQGLIMPRAVQTTKRQPSQRKIVMDEALMESSYKYEKEIRNMSWNRPTKVTDTQPALYYLLSHFRHVTHHHPYYAAIPFQPPEKSSWRSGPSQKS